MLFQDCLGLNRLIDKITRKNHRLNWSMAAMMKLGPRGSSDKSTLWQIDVSQNLDCKILNRNVSECIGTHSNENKSDNFRKTSEWVRTHLKTSKTFWNVKQTCKNIKKLRKISIKNISISFQFFGTQIFGWTHPNVSKCVKAGPNRPESFKKLCENVEKLRDFFWESLFMKFDQVIQWTQWRMEYWCDNIFYVRWWSSIQGQNW